MTQPKKFACAIMAAGQGKRMKSDLPKVLHELNRRPIIEYVVATARACGADPVIAIVGHKRELVIQQLGDSILYAVQAEQLGTGHAVQQAEPHLRDYHGPVLILSGDVPLLTVETVNCLTEQHFSEGNTCTIVTCIFDEPAGYGRVIRGTDGSVIGVVEHKDASDEQRLIKEINSGIYMVDAQTLFEALRHINNDNVQGEYYLPDILPYILEKSLRIGGLVLRDPVEIAGINSQEELAALEKEYLSRNK